MEFKAETGSEAYLDLLEAVVDNGRKIAPRDQATREITNVQVIISDARYAHVLGTKRRVNKNIMATETLQLLAGMSNLAQLDAASKGRFTRYADNGRLVGAYGPRVHQQLWRAVNLLQKDPDTRQAVITIWNGEEQVGIVKDVPCTQTLQFLIRGGQLRMRVNMRSSDAFLGIPYDWFMFSRLQMVVADHLGLEVGSFTHTAMSQHLYEEHLEQANHIIDEDVDDAMEKAIPPALLGDDDPETQFGAAGNQLIRSQSLAGMICQGFSRDWQENLHRYTEDVQWYLSHVPQQANMVCCPKCRYVLDDFEVRFTPAGYACDQCEAGK